MHRFLLGACLAAAGCTPATLAPHQPETPARLDVATVKALDLEARKGCAGGTWTPIGATDPTSIGTVTESWTAARCGVTRRLNFLIREDASGAREVTALLPGATRFTPDEQRAATLSVLARADGEDCEERVVVDTAVAGDGEVWTVDACGDALRYGVVWETDQDAAVPVLVITRPAASQ